MNIAEKIKAIRETKRIKQIEVANKLDLDPAYYARLEKRGDKLTIEQLKQIAGALDVGISELLDIEVQNTDNQKVNELEKRILELEDRVKDKESLIYNFEKNITQTVFGLVTAINNYLLFYATKEDVLEEIESYENGELVGYSVNYKTPEDEKRIFEKHVIPFKFVTSFIDSPILDEQKLESVAEMIKRWKSYLVEYRSKNNKKFNDYFM